MAVIGYNTYQEILKSKKITFPEEKALNELVIYNGDLDYKKLISVSDYLDANEDRIKTKILFNKLLGITDDNINKELFVMKNILNSIGIIKDSILLSDVNSRINKLYSLMTRGGKQ